MPPAPSPAEEAEAAAAAEAEAAAAAAAPAKKGKGKADDPAADSGRPKAPELIKEFIVPLAPLLVGGRNGNGPEIIEDVCALLAGVAEGLEGFRIGVTCSGPLLSLSVGAHLNPMLVTVEGVHKLPFEQNLGQTRNQVAVAMNAFGKRRVAEAQSINSRGGAKFQFHNVFFVGTWNQREFRDYLQTERLAVEVHDRGKPSLVATAGQPEGEDASSSAPPDPASHFGVARFSLAELLNMRRAWPMSLRVGLEPAGVGSGPSGSVLGKSQRSSASGNSSAAEFRAALFGDGARDFIASLDTPRSEYAPSYIQNEAYVTLKVAVARPLHPQPLPDRRERSEILEAEEDSQAQAGDGQAQEPPASEDVRGQPADAAVRYERYQRVVIVMHYRASSLAKNLINFIHDNNVVAASVDEGQARALAAVELSKEQRSDPNLDILTGFVLIDRKTRIVVIEGLRDGVAWPKLLDVAGVGKDKNTKRCRILYNPGIGFKHRIYTDFNLCLKQIKLRAASLEKLVHRSDLYDSRRSEKEAATALMRLAELKRAERLHLLKASTCFPTAVGLTMLEMQYGDFVSDAELIGGCVQRDAVSDDDSTSNSTRSTPNAKFAQTIALDRFANMESNSDDDSPASRTYKSRALGVEATDCKNDAYCESIALRKSMGAPDWLARNKETIAERSLDNTTRNPFGKKKPDASFLEARASEADQRAAVAAAVDRVLAGHVGPVPPHMLGASAFELPVHTYSGQKLNSAEMQKRALRSKMEGNEKHELWTYSNDKNSGCFPLLENDIDLANILRAPDPNYKDSREPYRYPKPRGRGNYTKPDRDVSDGRREELLSAWDERVASKSARDAFIEKAFDSKTLGTGGAHVIEVRRPGLRNPENAPLPGPTLFERETPRCPRIQTVEMKYPHQNNMGSMNMVDKYNSHMLEGEPMSKGLIFANRRVPDDLTQKYGSTMKQLGNCEAAPVSILSNEYYAHEPRNSLHPFQLALLCAKDLVHKPQLSAREKRFQDTSSANKNQLSGTLASWQKASVSGKTRSFQKPGFVPHAVPLSAR